MTRPKESHVRRIYAALLSDYVGPLLATRGFKASRQNQIHQLRDGDCRYRVTSSFTKDRAADAGTMAVHICVAFESIWKRLSTHPPFKSFSLFSAAGIGCNLCMAVPRSIQPRWSRIEAQTDIESVGDELVAHLENYGLLLLEKSASIDAAVEYWEGQNALSTDQYALAVAHALRGRSSDARRVVRKIRAATQEMVAAKPLSARYRAWLDGLDDFAKLLEQA